MKENQIKNVFRHRKVFVGPGMSQSIFKCAQMFAIHDMIDKNQQFFDKIIFYFFFFRLINVNETTEDRTENWKK